MLHVDFDRDLWVYVPAEWPWQEFASSAEWRDALVSSIGDAFGYDGDMRDWLGSTLEGLARSVSPGEHRFALLARPHEDIAMASLYELPRSDEIALEEMLGANDPRAVRTPRLTDFAGRLGSGSKCVRHTVDAPESGAISAVAHWVWRLADRDVVMIVGDGDLPRFERLQADFDALARSIGLASDDGSAPDDAAVTEGEHTP